VLPDFLIIGAQKAATTSLQAALAREKFCQPSWRKETHFFDHNYFRGIGYYRRYFPFRFTMKILSYTRGSAMISCEASPDYVCHPLAFKRIRAELGLLPLIVVLRNPVTRAISQYYHNLRVGGSDREPLVLEEALKAEKNRIGDDVALLEQGVIGYSPAVFFHGYVFRGLYAEQLRRYSDWIETGRFKVVIFEEFISNQSKVLTDVFSFLGKVSVGSDVAPAPAKNVGFKNKRFSRQVIEDLIAAFSEDRKELESLIGRRLDCWDEENENLLKMCNDDYKGRRAHR